MLGDDKPAEPFYTIVNDCRLFTFPTRQSKDKATGYSLYLYAENKFTDLYSPAENKLNRVLAYDSQFELLQANPDVLESYKEENNAF